MSEDEVIQLEGPETTIAELAEEVSAAEEALLGQLGEHEDAPTPRQLQAEARGGRSAQVMSIAFWRLVNSGGVELDKSGRVHPGQAAAASTPGS